jgi:hypothetical protein
MLTLRAIFFPLGETDSEAAIIASCGDCLAGVVVIVLPLILEAVLAGVHGHNAARIKKKAPTLAVYLCTVYCCQSRDQRKRDCCPNASWG